MIGFDLHMAYFSPTWTTQAILRTVARGMGTTAREYDLTPVNHGFGDIDLGGAELALFGSPVYGGRLPKPAAERFGRFRGAGAPAVAVVVYGNRHYDDALLELKDLLTERGFVVAAAAAFVAQHTFSSRIAPGRPDPADLAEAERFGAKAQAKARAADRAPPAEFDLPVSGNRPYREFGGVPFKPQVAGSCTGCRTCARNCPTGAIRQDSPGLTDAAHCIACARCARVCPERARHFPEPAMEQVARHLKPLTAARRPPETFF